jgi:hypothetical protein
MSFEILLGQKTVGFSSSGKKFKLGRFQSPNTIKSSFSFRFSENESIVEKMFRYDDKEHVGGK